MTSPRKNIQGRDGRKADPGTARTMPGGKAVDSPAGSKEHGGHLATRPAKILPVRFRNTSATPRGHKHHTHTHKQEHTHTNTQTQKGFSGHSCTHSPAHSPRHRTETANTSRSPAPDPAVGQDAVDEVQRLGCVHPLMGHQGHNVLPGHPPQGNGRQCKEIITFILLRFEKRL